MAPSEQIKAFIKARESLVLKPHWDALGGVYDIGYGHVLKGNELETVVGGDGEITREEADALFDIDCLYRADALTGMLTVEVPQQVFDACLSLMYNIGNEAFRQSTLLQYINASMLEAACISFLDWNKAGGKFVQGLLNRRALEMLVFARGEYRA